MIVGDSFRDRAGRWLARALAAVVLAGAVAYLGWRLTTLGSGATLMLSIPLFVLEVWAGRPSRCSSAPPGPGPTKPLNRST